MTFAFAPWAVDGAVTGSALARRAQYNAMSGSEGIAQRGDLKVTQTGTPSNSILISAGDATILNRYIDPAVRPINEVYTVSNPETHTVLSTSMPAAQPVAKSYLVLVTVGDSEFSQVGHPWMTSDVLDEAEAADYEYVRVWFVECPAGTKSFAALGLKYPAYAIARLDLPANHTQVTSAMIVDLRKLARPRSKEELFLTTSSTANDLQTVSPSYERWPNVAYTVDIPEWATVMKVEGIVTGATITGAADANIRVAVQDIGNTVATPVNRSAPSSGTDRLDIIAVGKLSTIGYGGTSKTIAINGNASTAPYASRLHTDAKTASSIKVRFEEEPV